MSTPAAKPANKVVLPLVIAGALLLPMMGCGGLLMLGAVGMAVNNAETDGPASMTSMQGGYPNPGYGNYPMPNTSYNAYEQGRGPMMQGGMPSMQRQMPIGASGNEGYGQPDGAETNGARMPTPPIGMAGGVSPTDTSGGMGGVSTYDARADTPGVNGFSEYIRDQSTLQDNNTGEVVRGVDNTVVQPLVESGTASVVSSDTPATE